MEMYTCVFEWEVEWEKREKTNSKTKITVKELVKKQNESIFQNISSKLKATLCNNSISYGHKMEILATPLLIHLWAIVPAKTSEDGPDAVTPGMGDLDGVPEFWLWSDPALLDATI